MDDKAKRVRSLLSSYYGQSGSGSGGGAAERALPAIDTATFDAESYVNKLV